MKRGKAGRIMTVVLVFLMFSMSFVLAFNLTAFAFPTSVVSKPLMHVAGATSASTNWSGYAVQGGTGSVTAVYGSWVVPQISCSGSTTYAAIWVGIDGYSSSTVEQTGILEQCSSGSAVYYAWYEFYPNPMYTFPSVTVSPGDIITASVTYGSNGFTATMSSSGGGSSSKTQAVSGAAQSSAEWIVERPSLCNAFHCSLSTLADFGTAQFGSVYTSVAGTSEATVNGVRQAIGSFSSSVAEITMVSNNGTPLAQPSALSSDGTSFTINYVASSTTTTTSTISTTSSGSSTTTSTSSGSTTTTTKTHGHGHGGSTTTSTSSSSTTTHGHKHSK